MSDITKKAIKASFLNLLDKMPLSEITVKKLSCECGINRNTFYYHYEDIPSLIEEIIAEELAAVFPEKYSADSLETGIFSVVDYALKNKRALYHIYNSVNRSIFEDYLRKYSDNIIMDYLKPEFERYNISAENRELVLTLIRSLISGLTFDFINSGMSEKSAADIHKIFILLHGMLSEVLTGCDKL